MKLTKDKLKSIIREVIAENQKNSMIISENMEMPTDEPQQDQPQLPTSPTFEKILAILEGRDQSVRSVVIMSGQNPMAEKNDAEKNLMLAKKLEKDIASMGLQYIPVGGKFSGHDEDSVMILNPSREQAEQLNRMYKQWGYVWGQGMPNFEMIQIDYKSDQGEFKAPGSKTATSVDAGLEAQAATDNYSFDYASKRKFIISLY
tara:strand:+ start:1621 stop:2229 length:609 start_codon:yes stop_codon:yes gene_type:complete